MLLDSTLYLSSMQLGKYDVPKWLSRDTVKVLDDMLQVVPLKRVSTGELLSHPWIVKDFEEQVSWQSHFKVRHNRAAAFSVQ